MLILKRLVEVTKGVFEKKMREIEKNQGLVSFDKIRKKLKRPLFN